MSQELLPSLLHTARCFKIKGLDNVQPPPGLVEQSVSRMWNCLKTFKANHGVVENLKLKDQVNNADSAIIFLINH